MGRFRGIHGHVNVFEYCSGSDATAAVRGLDQVVAGSATMFASQSIHENTRLGNLLGFDEKARAIDFPGLRHIPHVRFPLLSEGKVL